MTMIGDDDNGPILAAPNAAKDLPGEIGRSLAIADGATVSGRRLGRDLLEIERIRKNLIAGHASRARNNLRRYVWHWNLLFGVRVCRDPLIRRRTVRAGS
jgi:hypothetical protein